MVRENDWFCGDSQPLGQDLTSLLQGLEGNFPAIQRRRRQWLVETWMIDVAADGIHDDDLAGSIARFLAHSSKQVRHFVVVHLSPFFERVVMTSRACQAQPHETQRWYSR